MAIKPETRKEIGGAFIDALGLDVDAQLDARRHVGYQLDQCADLLPEPDAWATRGHGEKAELLLLAGDVLFTVTREQSGEDRQLVVASHPARLTEVTYRRSDRQTVWRFEFKHRRPLDIVGSINVQAHPDDAETFDQAESFARALAVPFGWAPPDNDATDQSKPADEELREL